MKAQSRWDIAFRGILVVNLHKNIFVTHNLKCLSETVQIRGHYIWDQ